MKKTTILFAVIVIAVSTAAGTVLYRQYTQTPYTMAWDMAAHTYYGAELAQDIRSFRPLAFFDHINDSSIALWPFLHPFILSFLFVIFGFTEKVAVQLTLVFSVLTVFTAFLTGRLTTDKRSAAPGLIAAFLLLSSSLYLGFSSYVMLEVFGAFFTLLTIILLYAPKDSEKMIGHVLPAVTMLLLFLTKINYGFYLLVPYLILEFISLSREKRKEYSALFLKYLDVKNPKSTFNILIVINIAAIILMMILSGFRLRIFGYSIEVEGTKNLIYLLIWLVFLKSAIFYFRSRTQLREKLHHRHLSIVRIVLAPILIWFLLSTGRAAEFVRMSSDRLTEYPFISLSNLIYYPGKIVSEYCCHISVGITVLALVAIALIRWRENPPIIRFLLIYVLFGYIGLTLKLRNFAEPRFFFIQAVAIFIIAGFELWHTGGRIRRFGRVHLGLYYSAVGVAAILLLIFPIRHIYIDRLPEIIRTSASTGDPRLGRLVDKTVGQIRPNENTIAIIGESNEISPFLIEWELVKDCPERILKKIEPPVKILDGDGNSREFELWLNAKDADAIICVAVADVSPYARTVDFETRHVTKQQLVEKMEKQKIYPKISEESWPYMAIEVRLYKPETEREE